VVGFSALGLRSCQLHHDTLSEHSKLSLSDILNCLCHPHTSDKQTKMCLSALVAEWLQLQDGLPSIDHFACRNAPGFAAISLASLHHCLHSSSSTCTQPYNCTSSTVCPPRPKWRCQQGSLYLQIDAGNFASGLYHSTNHHESGLASDDLRDNTVACKRASRKPCRRTLKKPKQFICRMPALRKCLSGMNFLLWEIDSLLMNSLDLSA
jgi:hypothetical protein